MSYQFCCMVQALWKSANQSQPNFKSLCSDASDLFFTFNGPILYLMWISWIWRICSWLMRPLKGTNGAGLGIPCEKMSLQRPDKLCNAIIWNGIRRWKGRPCDTWRRTVERECKNLNKTWSDMKQLAQSRIRCRVGPMSRSESRKWRRTNSSAHKYSNKFKKIRIFVINRLKDP